MLSCVFVIFPYDVQGQEWYLIVSFPEFCLLLTLMNITRHFENTRLFLAVLGGCLQFVIVVFPDHTHLLFLLTHISLASCLEHFKLILYLGIGIIIRCNRSMVDPVLKPLIGSR